MEEEKYSKLKQIACGVLFTAAAAMGALYAYSVLKDSPKGVCARVQNDASGIAKDNYTWFSEHMKQDYAVVKDPWGSVKRDAKALEDVVKGREIKDN